MKFKRALGITFLIYIASFIVGIITMIALGLHPDEMREAPLTMCIISFVAMAIFAVFGTLWYLRGSTVTWKEGAKFALVGILLSFVLDIVMFSIAPIQGENPKDTIINYYSGYLFWVSLIIYLGTSSLTAWYKSKRR